MQKFKDAGVRVDAVLVDYEGDPYPWPHLFRQLSHCRRCRQELPAAVVQNESAWRDYAWTQYVGLYDTYFAKPILEVFPDALVTNWHVVHSSREVPVRYFVNDISLPELHPQYFTATNPIAYASDAAWRNRWDPATELTQGRGRRFLRKRNRPSSGSGSSQSRGNRTHDGAEHSLGCPSLSHPGSRILRCPPDESRALSKFAR